MVELGVNLGDKESIHELSTEDHGEIVEFQPSPGVMMVKALTLGEATKGGIILPAGVGAHKRCCGKVLACGEPAYDAQGKPIPVRCEEGDDILFGFQMEAYKFNHARYGEVMIIDHDDVLGVIKWGEKTDEED